MFFGPCVVRTGTEQTTFQRTLNTEKVLKWRTRWKYFRFWHSEHQTGTEIWDLEGSVGTGSVCPEPQTRTQQRRCSITEPELRPVVYQDRTTSWNIPESTVQFTEESQNQLWMELSQNHRLILIRTSSFHCEGTDRTTGFGPASWLFSPVLQCKYWTDSLYFFPLLLSNEQKESDSNFLKPWSDGCDMKNYFWGLKNVIFCQSFVLWTNTTAVWDVSTCFYLYFCIFMTTDPDELRYSSSFINKTVIFPKVFVL